jgi:hypothetical protein
MTVRAECENWGHKWDLVLKPCETFTCPNCKTVYNALIVMNDPENENDILCMIGKDEFVVGYYHTKNKRYYTTDGKEISVIAWQVIKKAPILL